MADNLGTDLDQLLPLRGQRPVLDLHGQRQCLLWVKSPRSPGVPSTSEAEGTPDLPRPWPGPPLVANYRPLAKPNVSETTVGKSLVGRLSLAL